MQSEQHLPYRSTADVVVLDGDGSRWAREDVSRKNGASSPIASPTVSRDAELARRLMVNEFRYASTGAYRHVDALDVISGAIGVDAEGKYSSEIEREVYTRLADIIEDSTAALSRPRKRTRKAVAWLVVDYGGEYEDKWEHLVRAFTDRDRAQACRRIRKHRCPNPGFSDFFTDDYVGTYIMEIEVVIDE